VLLQSMRLEASRRLGVVNEMDSDGHRKRKAPRVQAPAEGCEP
jgi:hypothetical protein